MADPREIARYRVARSPEAIWSKPRRSAKRRRCDGHLSDRHFIEAGAVVIWSALPPGSDAGNVGWWHAAFCIDCAPESTVAGLAAVPGGESNG